MNEPQTRKLKAQLTPKGVLKFPALHKPDTYKGDTKYKTGLLLDPSEPEVQAFIKKLEGIRDEHIVKVQQWLEAEGKPGLAKKVKSREVVKDDLDKEGNETGYVVINAAMKAEYRDRSTGEMKKLSPKFFDSKGKKIDRAPEIWGGTVARLGLDLMPTLRAADGAWGVGFFLDAVFVIDLKGPSARGSSAYGYTPEEGGYDSSESVYDMPEGDTDSVSDSGEDDDF